MLEKNYQVIIIIDIVLLSKCASYENKITSDSICGIDRKNVETDIR